MNLFKSFFKGDKVLWIIFALFCLISIVEVFSASSTLTYKSGDHWLPITGHMKNIAIGVGAAWLIHRAPFKFLHWGYLIMLLSWPLLLYVLVYAETVNGAQRWIDIFGFHFQPSEMAKMGAIFWVARILCIHQVDEKPSPQAFKWILIPTLISLMLIVSENLSTAVLLFATVFLMMFVGQIPWKQIGKLTGSCILLVAVGILMIKFVPTEWWKAAKLERISTWQTRLDTFFNEESVPAARFDINTHAQIAYSNIAIAGSNVIGKGPGNSVQRDFLPQAFSDFIYAIIIEELGLGGGFFVALLYIILLIRIGKTAKNCDNTYYNLLIMGIGMLIGLQAMFNMLVAVGIMPVTGQPLPFISKGGSSLLINGCYMGILLNVSRYVIEKKEQKETEEEEKQTRIRDAATVLLQEAAERINLEEQGKKIVDSDIK